MVYDQYRHNSRDEILHRCPDGHETWIWDRLIEHISAEALWRLQTCKCGKPLSPVAS